MSLFNIFLADDDEDDRFTFSLALEPFKENVSLTTASDGQELIDKLFAQDAHPSLIILDNNMPRKDGITCLREIRATKKFEPVPVVIFSTSADTLSVERAAKYGADHYIQKPHNLSQLRKIINFCMKVDRSTGRSGHAFLIDEHSVSLA